MPDRAAARPDPEITAALVGVCSESRLARLNYTTEAGRRLEVEVEPWFVVVRHGRWYLLCRLLPTHDVRAYRVDRVAAVTALTGRFDPPRGVDPIALLESEVLEEHLSHLDAAEADLESVSLRLAALQRASLDRLFGHEISTTLGELVSDISAGKSFGSATAAAGDSEWGIIKVSAMTWGTFDASQNKAVAGDRVDPRFEIRPGDLLVSRANTSEYVGASVLVGEVRPRLLLSDKSLRVTPRSGVNVEWLWRALQAPSARQQISSLATGTKDSMRNISQLSLRAVRLPSADPAAQQAALDDFANIERSAARLSRAISTQATRAVSLKRTVLAAAFEGKLTGRHTDDDVIQELADDSR